MAGYVRVDTSNNISDGNVIAAADLDNEFDGIQAAFNASTGHNHDGTTGEGAPILVLGPTQDVVVGASTVTPKTTNTVDIGSSSLKFKDLFLAGNASVGGTLGVTGVATLGNGAVLGTPTSVTLTNATGLPIATGVSGLGTGVATALAVNVGSAGAPVLFNGALGTPSSGTVTNLTGTASININGTVGATTPTTGAFTTLTTSSTVTLNGGTANGVSYLDASKVLTTGSGFTFNGTALTIPSYLLVASSQTYLGDNGVIGGGSADGNTTLSYFGGKYLAFKEGSSEQMRLTSTGLGIGTSSPAAKLQVNSVGETFIIAGGGTGTQYQRFNTTGGNYYLGVSSSTGTGLLGGASAYSLCLVTESARDIHFGTNNTLRATIDTSGNLGLGVTPSAWTSYVVQDINTRGLGIAGGNDSGEITVNAYYDAPNWKYKGTSSYGVTRYNQFNGAHSWYTAPSGTAGDAISFSQSMTLDASGNLGVGVTSPSDKLQVNGGVTFGGDSGTNRSRIFESFGLTIESGGAGGGRAIIFGTNNTERARITSGGDLLVGTTSNVGSARVNVSFSGPSNDGVDIIDSADGSGSQFIAFRNSSGTAIGTVTRVTTTNSVTYNTTSDYRLKTVIGPVADAGQRIDALQPVEYTWNASGERTRGFLAHQFQEVYAGSVSGTKDAVDAEGKPVYQSMQASSSEVIADLVAEIQSLRQRLAAAGI